MKRLLWLPLVAAVVVLAVGHRAACQPEEEFGVLKTTPATPAPSAAPAPRTLPAGIVPDRAANAPPVNPFPISAEAGPWMICAATYLGLDGPELSRQVVLELRNRHKLPAYVYNRGDEERRKQEEEWKAMQARHPGVPLRRRYYRVQDQYAVLVGGYKDFQTASAALPGIKKLPPPELKLEGKKSAYEVMTYQDLDPNTQKPVTRQALVNPFHSAMVVRNPTAPNTAPAKPKWDPFWKQLNANEEFSLLKNPKAWTLVVKEYMGARTLQPRDGGGSFLNMLGLGGSRPGEALDAAAQQAHALAEFLRKHPHCRFETWVLHTRHSSVVCVGGFDGLDDPALHQTIKLLSSLRFNAQTGNDPIGLLPNPVPVEVPRP